MVNIDGLSGDTVPAVLFAHVGPGVVGQPEGELIVGQDPQHGVREGVRVARVELQPGFLVHHDLAQAPGVSDNGGGVHGHRLQNHHSERLVEAGHHCQVRAPVEGGEVVGTDMPGELDLLLKAEVTDKRFQLVQVGSASRHHERDVGDLVQYPGHRLDNRLNTFLVDKSSHEEHELVTGVNVLLFQQVDAHVFPEALGVYPVGDDLDLVGGQLEDVGYLFLHVPAAAYRANRLESQPPLDLVDQLVHRAGKVPLVPSVLGGVNRGHHRYPVGVFEARRGVCHQPVVCVNDVDVIEVVNQRHRLLQKGHVELEGPGDPIFLGDVGGVVDNSVDMDTFRLLVIRLAGVVLGYYVYLGASGGQGCGKVIYVPSQAADDTWGVLPTQDEDPQQIVSLRFHLKATGARDSQGRTR